MVVAQIILLSLWFSKKKNQKDLVEMVRSKITCLEWHFGQVGHEGKNTIWGVFLTEIPSKKGHDFLWCHHITM